MSISHFHCTCNSVSNCKFVFYILTTTTCKLINIYITIPWENPHAVCHNRPWFLPSPFAWIDSAHWGWLRTSVASLPLGSVFNKWKEILIFWRVWHVSTHRHVDWTITQFSLKKTFISTGDYLPSCIQDEHFDCNIFFYFSPDVFRVGQFNVFTHLVLTWTVNNKMYRYG